MLQCVSTVACCRFCRSRQLTLAATVLQETAKPGGSRILSRTVQIHDTSAAIKTHTPPCGACLRYMHQIGLQYITVSCVPHRKQAGFPRSKWALPAISQHTQNGSSAQHQCCLTSQVPHANILSTALTCMELARIRICSTSVGRSRQPLYKACASLCPAAGSVQSGNTNSKLPELLAACWSCFAAQGL